MTLDETLHALRARLSEALSPQHLELVDESHGHRVPRGLLTHLRVIVVAPCFSGRPRIARHRLVYAALGDAMQAGLHAVAVEALTPEEWSAQGDAARSTAPPCHGGSLRDKGKEAGV